MSSRTRKPRIRALVRRSTNRAISFSCRVSESRSSRPRVLPCQSGRVGQPVGAVGDIGQRAHAGEPGGQGVDLAVGAVELAVLAGDPVLGDALAPAWSGAGRSPWPAARAPPGASLRKSGRLADVPQPHRCAARSRGRGRRRRDPAASWRSVVSSSASADSFSPSRSGGLGQRLQQVGQRCRSRAWSCATRPRSPARSGAPRRRGPGPRPCRRPRR